MLGYLVPAAMLHPSQLRAQLPSSSFLVNCISIDYFAVNIVWTYLINVSRVFGLMSIFIDPLLPFLLNALNQGVWVQARWWRVPLISCAPARGLELLE